MTSILRANTAPTRKPLVQDLYISEDTTIRRIDCKSIVDTTTTIRTQTIHSSARIDYSKPCDICCWHCCHTFRPHPPIGIPHVYDAKHLTYAVYGVFCSFACAKSYLIEHSRFDGGHHILLLKSMALNVYGLNADAVIEAPPRIDLVMFGGTKSIEAFRSNQTLRLAEMPPFVAFTTVIEERSKRDERIDIEGMRRPDVPPMEVANPGERGMYYEFLKQQCEHESQSVAPQPKTISTPATSSSLHRFMKVRSDPSENSDATNMEA